MHCFLQRYIIKYLLRQLHLHLCSSGLDFLLLPHLPLQLLLLLPQIILVQQLIPSLILLFLLFLLLQSNSLLLLPNSLLLLHFFSVILLKVIVMNLPCFFILVGLYYFLTGVAKNPAQIQSPVILLYLPNLLIPFSFHY